MSKGITESTVEEIKARIDLADLIASYGIQVKTAGATKKACCPFHHEKTPSFNINDRKGFYHCFGCGESGDAIKFVQKMDGLSFVEAVKKLAGQCGIQIEEKEDPEAGKRKRLFALMAELAQFYHRCLLKTKEAELAREYLAKRALDGEVADNWLIGYAPSGVATILTWAEKYRFTPEELEEAGVIKAPTRPGDQGYHRFGGRLMFSICDKQGRVVGFSGRQLVASKNSGKYVNSPETPLFSKKRILFGFDRAAGNIAKSPHHEVVICEGQIDCIRLHLSGFGNAVAGQGTAFTEEHVKMLKRVTDTAVLVYDDDAAGHKATIKSAGMLLAAEIPVRVVSLPGGDDPDSFLRAHPAEDFQKLLDNAESILSFQVRVERAKEARPDTVDAMARVTKAILTTIAQAQSAIIRASMLGEAAKLLGLPTAALEEELGKVKAEARVVRTTEPVPEPEETEDASEETVEGADKPTGETSGETEEPAAAAIPPSERELALMAFLMSNEYDATLDGMVGEFLPGPVFAHGFTARFVETWRAEVATGSDLFGDFAAQLAPREQKWFDAVLLGGGKSESSAMSPTDILQDFVRNLWVEALKRRRGELPAAGDAAADAERMRLSMDIKCLPRIKWHDVKDRIKEFIKGEN